MRHHIQDIFNPFRRRLSEVREEDLETLKSVAEGWNVEYKREKPDGRKIAKSIASFANSHGGLYFIGVAADPSTNCAIDFPGVNESPDVIRDSVSGHLQPFPYFETFTISLANGNLLLMAVIPEGDNPPYIHSDGRIYRRQGAASEPITENNRAVVDELYSRAQAFNQDLENFRDFDLTFCKGEEEIPQLELFINTMPFRHQIIERFFDAENMRLLKDTFDGPFVVTETISDSPTSFSGNMRFDSVNSYHDSLSLRYLERHDLAYNGMTVVLDIFGNLKLLIPLSDVNASSEQLEIRYINVLRRSDPESVSSIRFLNARQIVGGLVALIKNYVDYMHSKGRRDTLEIKIRLRNCWRTTIYIDSERFVNHVETFGAPICMKSEQYFPFQPLKFSVDELRTRPIINTLQIFAHIANALGIPSDMAIAAVIEEMQNHPQPSQEPGEAHE